MAKKRKQARRKKVNKYQEFSKAPAYPYQARRCITKVSYVTEHGAEDARLEIEAKFPDRNLKTYFCPTCGNYHHATRRDDEK